MENELLEKLDRSYKNLEEIQNTIKEREIIIGDDYILYDHLYYNPENVCVIHVKFGRMQKAAYNVCEEVGLSKKFIKLFNEYWKKTYNLYDYNTSKKELIPNESEIKRHKNDVKEILDIVKNENLPIIFYNNFTDTELSYNDVISYFNL